MQTIHWINQSLAYIHAHYAEPITVADVADQVHWSPSWFAHVFAALTGYSVKSYIIRYRLYRAADEMITGSLPIVEIAMRHGFDSQQSFSKLFKRQHGLPPAQFRKRRPPLSMPLLKIPDRKEAFDMNLQKSFDDVQFVVKPAYQVAGIQCDIHYHPVSEGTAPIEALYRRWIEELLIDRIPGQASPPAVYGMTVDSTPTGEAAYRICVEVASIDRLPEGVCGWSIPETEYAVFETRLDIVLSGEFWRHFYGVWLPATGYSQPGAIVRSGKIAESTREVFEVYAAIPCEDDAPIRIMAPILRA